MSTENISNEGKGDGVLADVSVSLPKQMIIDEIDKRIDRLY